jgi:hypothetical protein
MIKHTKFWYQLIFIGLLAQSTLSSAWNIPKINVGCIWPTVKTLGSRFVNSRYFVPAAALALVAACGYISYKSEAAEYDYDTYDCNDGGHSLIPESEISRVPKVPAVTHTIQLGNEEVHGQQMQLHPDDQEVVVQQVPVLNQFGRNAGGGASCGYQALKNACAITSMILGDRSQNWHDWLVNPEQATRLFGLAIGSERPGAWREIVMHEYDKRALHYYIERLMPIRLLESTLAGRFNIVNIRSLFITLRGNYIRDVVNRICEDPRSTINISLDSFIEWVSAHAQEIEITDPTRYREDVSINEIQEFIKTRDIICGHINLDQATIIPCSLAMLADARKAYNNGSRNGHSYNGEWLHQGDIYACLGYVRREYAHLRDVPVVAVDSRIRHTEFNDEIFENIRSAIREKRPLPQQIYAFIVGNMRHSGEGGSQGHWTTLVLDAQRQNQRRYLVADSAGGNALRGGACMDLIRYFEGQPTDYSSRIPVKYAAEPIQAPKSSRIGRIFDAFLNWLDGIED